MNILFEHFIVIDFEATCDEPVNPEPQEIIEFPAVAIDVKSGKIIDEFHHFIKPVKHPQLTDFCKALTGISQETVDKGDDFKVVVNIFEQWLSGNNIKKFIILTCGEWDFSTIFPSSCAVHGIEIPSWAKKVANVKRIFTDTFPESRKMGLSGMLNYLDMEFEGHPHSGIDDTRNIARIVLKLLQQNGYFNSLNHTVSVNELSEKSSHDDKVRQLIIQLTPDCGKSVAEEIEWKIFDIAKQAPDIVFHLIRSENSVVREASVFVLWKLIEKGIGNRDLFIQSLSELTHDKDHWVSKKAYKAIERLNL